MTFRPIWSGSTVRALGTIVPLLLAALLGCAHDPSAADLHPVAVPAPPVCADCHSDWRASLGHTNDFSSRHRFLAAQQGRTCAMCHEQSFCSDCHAHKEELKPSDKFKDSPERALPHRGDYLNQHRVDGRIDPASCMRCHGRQNNERCALCHR